MSTEIRNWDVVAKAMEASGATSSQMYQRAKALAQGKLDPMPTSFPEAPYSISAITGWSRHITRSALQGVWPPSPEVRHIPIRFNNSSAEVLWTAIRPSNATQSDIATHPATATKIMFMLQMQWKHKIWRWSSMKSSIEDHTALRLFYKLLIRKSGTHECRSWSKNHSRRSPSPINIISRIHINKLIYQVEVSNHFEPYTFN